MPTCVAALPGNGAAGCAPLLTPAGACEWVLTAAACPGHPFCAWRPPLARNPLLWTPLEPEVAAEATGSEGAAVGDGLLVRLGRLLRGKVGLGPPADRRLGMDGLKPGVEVGVLRKPACCARRAFALALTISSAVMGLHGRLCVCGVHACAHSHALHGQMEETELPFASVNVQR